MLNDVQAFKTKLSRCGQSRPTLEPAPNPYPWYIIGPNNWYRSRALNSVLPVLGNGDRTVSAPASLGASVQPPECRRGFAPGEIGDCNWLDVRHDLGDH